MGNWGGAVDGNDNLCVTVLSGLFLSFIFISWRLITVWTIFNLQSIH